MKMSEIKRTMIAGTGSYVPERLLTNADLEGMVETSDEWIRTTTEAAREFALNSNMILVSDYYRET